MKKTESLKKNYEIKRVINNGKLYGGHYLIFFILPNNENKNYLCVTVTKKTGNSVIRNKIKRKLRENYHLMEENIKTGYSIVVMWKKNIESKNATFENIKKDFEVIFRKADILS